MKNSTNITSKNDIILIMSLFIGIYCVLSTITLNINRNDKIILEWITKTLLNDNTNKYHLTIPVLSYIKTKMGAWFILHVLIFVGILSIKTDLTINSIIIMFLRYTGLTGLGKYEESLQKLKEYVTTFHLVASNLMSYLKKLYINSKLWWNIWKYHWYKWILCFWHTNCLIFLPFSDV